MSTYGAVPAGVGNEGRHDTFLACPIPSPRSVTFVQCSTNFIVNCLFSLSFPSNGTECVRWKGVGIVGCFPSNLTLGRRAFSWLLHSILFDFNGNERVEPKVKNKAALPLLFSFSNHTQNVGHFRCSLSNGVITG